MQSSRKQSESCNVVKKRGQSKLRQKPEYMFTVEREPIHGFLLSNAIKGEKCNVALRNFLTDDINELFYTCLNEISRLYLNDWMLSTGNTESKIHNCLIVISPIDLATIYINLPTVATIVNKRISKDGIKKGEFISKEDIGDLKQIHFPGISIPPDCGVIYIFSVGWRKGLFFDFLPLYPQGQEHRGDLSTMLASFHSSLLFPEIFHIYPAIKSKMFERGWFPFIRLFGWRLTELSAVLKNDFPMEEIETTIVDSFDNDAIQTMFDFWLRKEPFESCQVLIDNGIKKFLQGDYISAIHILYPQIEGLLQHLIFKGQEVGKTDQLREKLTSTAKEKCTEASLYLPDEFNDYLFTVFFPRIDLTSPVKLTRHTLAHGVANENEFTKARAFQAILILDQIFYYI